VICLLSSSPLVSFCPLLLSHLVSSPLVSSPLVDSVGGGDFEGTALEFAASEDSIGGGGFR